MCVLFLIHLPCYGHTYMNKERLYLLLEKWSCIVFPGYWMKKVELYAFSGSSTLKRMIAGSSSFKDLLI